MSACRRMQIDPYLSPCTKLKSKWTKDLKIKPTKLNLIEEKMGSTLEHRRPHPKYNPSSASTEKNN